MGGSTRRTTAQDVADLVGVSRSSVSLVLNGRAEGNVTPAKQQAIIEAARQLNYRPNAVARSLRNRRTHTVGLLTWPGRSGFAEQLLYTSWRAAIDADYLLIFMHAAQEHRHQAGAVTALLDRQVDGFLVVAPELTSYRPLEMMAGKPTVLLNCIDPDGAVTSVVPNEFGAGACAAELLASNGHTQIALLGDDQPTEQSRQRVAGVRAGLAEAGLDPPLVLRAERTVDAAFDAVRPVLAGSDRPTGLVLTHERLALAALLAAADLGVGVPEDLSLVSLEDGELLAQRLRPALATVHRPDRAMAEQAVALLIGQLTGEAEATPQHLSFTCPPVPRASLAPPPQERRVAPRTWAGG